MYIYQGRQFNYRKEMQIYVVDVELERHLAKRFVKPANDFEPNAMMKKRDFQEVDPPKTDAEFYAKYDPAVGWGTGVGLGIFIMLFVFNMIVKFVYKKWKRFKESACMQRLFPHKYAKRQTDPNSPAANSTGSEVGVTFGVAPQPAPIQPRNNVNQHQQSTAGVHRGRAKSNPNSILKKSSRNASSRRDTTTTCSDNTQTPMSTGTGRDCMGSTEMSPSSPDRNACVEVQVIGPTPNSSHKCLSQLAVNLHSSEHDLILQQAAATQIRHLSSDRANANGESSAVVTTATIELQPLLTDSASVTTLSLDAEITTFRHISHSDSQIPGTIYTTPSTLNT